MKRDHIVRAVALLFGCSSDDAPSTGTASGETSTGTTSSSSGNESSSSTSESTGSGTDESESSSSSSSSGSTGLDDSSSGSSESSTGAPICANDEPVMHNHFDEALELPGLDCDEMPLQGVTVIDDATGPDWWWFPGTDPGECEPSVRVSVTAPEQLFVCAFVDDACTATCVQGVQDTSTGCCNLDVVEMNVACGPAGADDSTVVTFVVGTGRQQCLEVTFEYEF